jgi:hypothetical protein
LCAFFVGNGARLRAFFSQFEKHEEHTMPYLFWAVLPFALMDTWWGMCVQQHGEAK